MTLIGVVNTPPGVDVRRGEGMNCTPPHHEEKPVRNGHVTTLAVHLKQLLHTKGWEAPLLLMCFPERRRSGPSLVVAKERESVL
jgi:hypothetical protein